MDIQGVEMKENHVKALASLTSLISSIRSIDLVVPKTLVPPLALMRERGGIYEFLAELHALLESTANPHEVSYEAYLISKDLAYCCLVVIVERLRLVQLEAVHRVYRQLERELKACDSTQPDGRPKYAVSYDLQAVKQFYLLARERYHLYNGPRSLLESDDDDGFMRV